MPQVTQKNTYIWYTGANLTLTGGLPWLSNVTRIYAPSTTGAATQSYALSGGVWGGTLASAGLRSGKGYWIISTSNTPNWTLPLDCIVLYEGATLPSALPPAPAITSFTPTSGVAGASVTITGTNLSNAQAVVFGNVVTATPSVNSATSITVVVPSIAATGTVKVITAGGTATGGTFTVTVSATQLAAPASPQATTSGTTSLNLSASSVANATGYKLYRSATSNGSYNQVGGTLGTPSYTDAGLTAETTYYYKWQAVGNGTTYSDSPLGTAFSGITGSYALSISTDNTSNVLLFTPAAGSSLSDYQFEILA